MSRRSHLLEVVDWVCHRVFVEKLTRVIEGRRDTSISKIIQHPSNTMEIQIRKDSCRAKAGQYVFVCCPEISRFEWHPFTLTSSPNEGFVGMHIRIVGDWTGAFAKRCGYQIKNGDIVHPPKEMPLLMIDGPYGYGARLRFLIYSLAQCRKMCLITKYPS